MAIQRFSTCVYPIPEPPKAPVLCLVEEVIEVISFRITSVVMSAILLTDAASKPGVSDGIK